MARTVNINAEQLTLIEKETFAAVQADLAALRASFVALTAKLDADAGVTDTNYGALTNPAVQRTQP